MNEAYLRLTGRGSVDWRDRAHFFGVAAQIMRGLLVDHARARRAEKRGGTMVRVELDHAPPLAGPEPEEMLALDEALSRLAVMDARAARVVELRYFVGLDVEEAAAVLGVSEKTVKRDWVIARTWLSAELRK